MAGGPGADRRRVKRAAAARVARRRLELDDLGPQLAEEAGEHVAAVVRDRAVEHQEVVERLRPRGRAAGGLRLADPLAPRDAGGPVRGPAHSVGAPPTHPSVRAIVSDGLGGG